MRLKIQYWRPEFHSWSPAGDLSCGLSHLKKMINIWNHEDICQQVSYMYFLSRWYFLIQSETNLPVKIPPQQLLSIQVECFQVAMVLSAEIPLIGYICVIIPYPFFHGYGLVRATRRVDSCLCFVFRGNYRKKMEFWYVQCSHGQIAFYSYFLGQTALYLWKVICGKKKRRLHSYTYGCFLVSGAEVHTMHFLFVFKLLFEKRGGRNFWPPLFSLWWPKIYTWSPVGVCI